jgi:hypothetical protein
MQQRFEMDDPDRIHGTGIFVGYGGGVHESELVVSNPVSIFVSFFVEL